MGEMIPACLVLSFWRKGQLRTSSVILHFSRICKRLCQTSPSKSSFMILGYLNLFRLNIYIYIHWLFCCQLASSVAPGGTYVLFSEKIKPKYKLLSSAFLLLPVSSSWASLSKLYTDSFRLILNLSEEAPCVLSTYSQLSFLLNFIFPQLHNDRSSKRDRQPSSSQLLTY